MSQSALPASGVGRILVVDGTGRGHAICDLFTRTNPSVTVYYGPGCGVISDERIVPVPAISLVDVRTALDFLEANPVEFVFVSNIDALSRGYVDDLRRAGHSVIGPTAAAATLESSKAAGKRFCVEAGIPVPEFGVFTGAEAAKAYIRSLPYQCVVKADGLTPDGDGSMVCDSAVEALAAVDRFAAEFGDSLRLVVEERLTGPEVSVFALLDGASAVMFPLAMDYKRTLDGDAGKNCDGMGSIAPHPADSPALREQLRRTLVDPLVRGLRAEHLDFTGFVYIGAVLTPRGPSVVEINARFGDSEAEVVLPGVRSDFTALCRAVLAGELDRQRLVTDGLARCSVALVQGCLDPTDRDALIGWPFGDFATGQPVSGLPESGPAGNGRGPVEPGGATVYYANLRRDGEGTPITCGGRVLHAVGAGRSPQQARQSAYRQVERITFPGMRYRTDIGVTQPGRTTAGHQSDFQPGVAFMTSKKAFVLFEMMNAMLLVAREAKARGYHVIALNHDPLKDSGPFAVPPGLVDELVYVESWSDVASVGELVSGIARRYDVVGTYSVFEPTLPHESALRDLVGLPATSVENTVRVLDKLRVRQHLFAEGLSTLRSASLHEALEWDSWPFAGPAVLKPANGTGSALCFVVSSMAELRAAATRVRAADVVNPLMREYILAHGGFVLEEKAEGELLSVESMVCRGEVRFVGLTGRYVLANDPVVEQGLFFPYHHPRLSEIVAKSEAFHKSLEIFHGPTHLEVMVAEDGSIELIDFNARFAGFASAVSFGEAFRMRFETVLTDVACGIEPDLDFLRGDSRFVAEMVVLPPPGTTELHDVVFPPESIVPRLMKNLGQQLTGRADQLDAVGMFIIAGDTASEAHRKALEARRSTVVNGKRLDDNPNNVVAFSDFIGKDLVAPSPAGKLP